MDSHLQKQIYKAQCFGNVEPIEFMVPYPNLFSLVEGQNVKFKDSILYKDTPLLNEEFLGLANRAASWLASQGVEPESKIFLPELPFPYSEIMAFGIWNLGGVLVLSDDGKYHNNCDIDILNIISPKLDFQFELKKSNPNFVPLFKPNLLDEALLIWNKGVGIRLSHYNLLVNANGVQKALNLKRGSSIKVELSPTSTAWVIIQLILPFYTGAELTTKQSDITVGLQNQFNNSDYIIQHRWDKTKKTEPPTIYILDKNSGVLSINEKPIHLTEFKIKNKILKLNGHSVMMGYTNEQLNHNSFIENSLFIDIIS